MPRFLSAYCNDVVSPTEFRFLFYYECNPFVYMHTKTYGLAIEIIFVIVRNNNTTKPRLNTKFIG